MRWKIRSTKGG